MDFKVVGGSVLGWLLIFIWAGVTCTVILSEL